jgi:hypothetical protein
LAGTLSSECLRHARQLEFQALDQCARNRGEMPHAGELEASIKVEMEDICDWPTEITISVQPDGDSWKVAISQEGSEDDADRREMIEPIAARLS